MQDDRTYRNEQILNSLDGCERASVPDFFYTRLKARMEKEMVAPARRPLLRPAYVLAGLILILFINVAVVWMSGDQTEPATASAETETSQQTLASEYSLNDNYLTYEMNAGK